MPEAPIAVPDAALACPFCAGQRLQRWGPLSHHRKAVVAGRAVATSTRPFGLWRCRSCGFARKWPQPTAADLQQAYSTSDERSGEGPVIHARPLWRRLERLAHRHSPSKHVLDVGCSNGDLLASWSDGWLRHGVEPSRSAAAVAARRGLAIVASQVEELPAQQRFGCIVSVDVAEHIPAPLSWLQQLVSHLRPGGVLLLSTGCTDAWPWRLSGSRYWYAGFGEHLSFYGVESFRRFAAAAGLIWLGAHRHAHGPNGPLPGQLAKYALCRLSGPLWGRRSHPTLTAYPDHQLVVLQRPTSDLDGR